MTSLAWLLTGAFVASGICGLAFGVLLMRQSCRTYPADDNSLAAWGDHEPTVSTLRRHGL